MSLSAHSAQGLAPMDSRELCEPTGTQSWILTDEEVSQPDDSVITWVTRKKAAPRKYERRGYPLSALQAYEQKASRGGMNILRTAFRFMGVPYVWAGTSGSGFDCSGFVWRVFKINGISLPRMADSQFLKGKSVSRGDLRAGDLVFFSTYLPGPSHIGIYIGGNRFVHASSGRGVVVSSLGESYYSARYIGGRRLLRD
ncbi:MAG: C40 family peptidase [Armatimonadetes bacterium]|nr:C40 family peptidase [Armatimonadota bacterium]